MTQKQGKKDVSYVGQFMSFDIETTSYYEGDEKRAIVYSLAVSVGGKITVFRYMEEFVEFLTEAAEDYGLNDEHRMVIFVHNLAYEWQFIKHYFEWDLDSCFFTGNANHVIRAVTTNGIEFRCTLALTNMSLAAVGHEVGVAKMVGDLDYELKRHSETELTAEEMGYIENDVLIIDALINKKLQTDTLASLPMTRTGYVRRSVRKQCRAGKPYRDRIKKLNLTQQTYTASRQAYQGGYTHANAEVAGKVVENVVGYDLSSSYPASIVQFQFPMESFREVSPESIEDFKLLVNHHACLIDIEFVDLMSKYPFPVISESRCVSASGVMADNGRVFGADRVRMTITDVDFKLISRSYDFSTFTVYNMWAAEYDYLPTPLVMSILDLYRKKTVLKNVAGREEEYVASKGDCNGVYGMMATDPVMTKFELEEDLIARTEPMILEDALQAVNESKKKFLYYPWGVWTTAYSRFVLLSAVYDLIDAGVTVVYDDTDSIYAVDAPQIAGIIDEANQAIQDRMTAAMAHHGLVGAAALEYTEPRDQSGEAHPLGYYECETPVAIPQFKTLGAKRYAKLDSKGKFSITVSGLKKSAASYIEERSGMDFFSRDMVIPAGVAGRMNTTYSETFFDGVMTDYRGVEAPVEQYGFIHLEATGYSMSVSDAYMNFIVSMSS